MSKDFFYAGSLEDWSMLNPGEVIAFDAHRPRRVKVTIMTDSPAQFWVSYTPSFSKKLLVGVSHETGGETIIDFSASSTAFFQASAPEGSHIQIKGAARDQRVVRREIESYTSIAPRQRRNTDVDRIMMLLRYNQQQNEARHRQELAALRTEFRSSRSSVSARSPATEPSEVEFSLPSEDEDNSNES